VLPVGATALPEDLSKPSLLTETSPGETSTLPAVEPA
jgi:hypothetical protein